ncbi:MAG: peptide deformylase [Candidatus Omnitrophica bacterium]|nr:peptide deformylase [Candidatus Omnitrophota bacterium]
MEEFRLRTYPQRILRKKCESVEKVTEREKIMLRQMLAAMRRFAGIGLAAPQVGIGEQMLVAEAGARVVKLINPRILQVQGADRMEEGCLSVPGAQVEIERAYRVRVRGVDERGDTREIHASGLLARVLQHEIDHLHGRLIVDYWPLWSRLKFRMGNVK